MLKATSPDPSPANGGRRRLIALLVLALALALVAGCGDSDADREGEIAAEREDAAKEARAQARIRQLEKDLKEIERNGDGAPSSGAAPEPTALVPSFGAYTSSDGGWQAQVPVGDGWSEGVETQVNPGLHRTTFTGPGGAVLIVDSTPNETPSFSGSAPQSSVSHPIFSGATKLIFRGNTSVTPCETSTCVDYLLPSGGGGYAVLAGGPGNFSDFEAIGEAVMLSLSPTG